jgi:hypothetical protein
VDGSRSLAPQALISQFATTLASKTAMAEELLATPWAWPMPRADVENAIEKAYACNAQSLEEDRTSVIQAGYDVFKQECRPWFPNDTDLEFAKKAVEMWIEVCGNYDEIPTRERLFNTEHCNPKQYTVMDMNNDKSDPKAGGYFLNQDDEIDWFDEDKWYDSKEAVTWTDVNDPSFGV